MVSSSSPRRCALVLILAVSVAGPALAQSDEDCMMCHEDPELVGERDGREISVHVDPSNLAASVHDGFECVDCHQDLMDVELPHEDDVAPVDCSMCHDAPVTAVENGVHAGRISCADCHGSHRILAPGNPDSSVAESHVRELCGVCHPTQARQHAASLHGRAAARGDELAPSCVSCHGSHEILSSGNPQAQTSTMNIPVLCGTCHHEGTEVSLERDIPQERILENYSQSIHGEGLYRQGLTVTAVCTSCHTSHFILEHDDPRSSIHRDNVADTCTTCHARIEEVHVKVVEGRLWEEEPHKIPSCVECHQPHKIRRRPPGEIGVANQDCMRCHGDPNLATVTASGEMVSLYVDEKAFYAGAHSGTACAQCHVDVTPDHPERPCATLDSPVDCSICHAQQVDLFEDSSHGRLAAAGDPDAPVCLDCHEKHATLPHTLPISPTFSRNVPELCAGCHRQDEVAARRIEADVPVVLSYTMSIHGRGLIDSGLVVSATCTDCHTTHHMLPPTDPGSSVHESNVADTCGACHHGIEEIFKTSIHWPGNVDTDEELPTCEDCHTSHRISRTDVTGFRFMMMEQCGRCHEDEADTFFETHHGKVSRLGSEGAAKCYDCHGTHEILPTSNPDSRLSRRNVVETCAQCHPGAHRQFAGYLTHATHHDRDKYPFLFFAFWFMTLLLVGTLTFFILHTLFWLWRLWRTREQWRAHRQTVPTVFYRRFTSKQRTMHLVMLLSFFTLALTGMALKFSYMTWALVLSKMLGGFATMAILHRIGAIVLIALFAYHLADVVRLKRESGTSWRRFIFGPDSLMFTWNDVVQFGQSIRWFVGMGPRPRFGRFTYWEKFDYFAVFWGVLVIGSTGLVLWFPELFTRVLPGWSVNVATIIHSDEALLAVGFIFTIHFFNTHFRPDKFPMDPVIFTGRVPLDELRHDKPEEYRRYVEEASEEEQSDRLTGAADHRLERVSRIFGFTALGIGLTLIFLILYAMLFGYR